MSEHPPDDKLIHRDDVPMDIAEAIVEECKELFPGMKVVFAGDAPDSEQPTELSGAAEKLQQAFRQSVREGRCFDCGKQMPDWPPEDWDAWEVPAGWRYFVDMHDELQAFQCPECDSKEGDGPTLVNVKDLIDPEDS